MKMILAQATVDKIRDGPVPLWEVTVWGIEHDYRRTYQLEMPAPKDAAMHALGLFEDEIEDLIEAQA